MKKKPQTRASEQKREDILPFIRMQRGKRARLKQCLRRESKSSLLVAENGTRFMRAWDEGLRAIRAVRRQSVTAEGLPLLYALSLEYLIRKREDIDQGSLAETLADAGGRFEDDALSLTFPFLTIAALSLYLETGEQAYLSALRKLFFVDFSAIFFRFSAAEQSFLSEKAGVYKHADAETKNLYHRRLAHLAKAEGKDPSALAETIVRRANKENTHIGAILTRERESGGSYFVFLLFITLIMTALFLITFRAGFWRLLLIPPSLILFHPFAKHLLTPFFAGSDEKILPKITSGDAISKTKVLVSIATFLYGEEKDRHIFDKLEDFFLTNGGENIAFAILGDLPQSKRRTDENDTKTVAYARARISALREKYGPFFYLFIRERRRSESEGAYICWERKRGGVLELCRLLRGGETSITPHFTENTIFSEVKYLITLDADTNLGIGTVRVLLGTMLHPENKPVFDDASGRVVSGHAVIQPRMIPSLFSSSETAFARLTGGAGGLDPYAAAASDLYQTFFDEGIYCGKGILDIDLFLRACDGFFPRERILSHDLAEGNLLRAALATDIVLSDGTPKTALSYYMRKHRWLRGDLQILPYLFRFVKNEKGERIPNPMSPLSKYKIFDNLLQALVPLSSLFLLLAGFLAGGVTAQITVFFVLFPLVYRAWETIFSGFCHRCFTALPEALSAFLFSVGSMAYDAYLVTDAAVRTLYRFFISKRNFLNWTTAFDGDRFSARSPDAYYRRFLPSVLIGLLFLFLRSGFALLLGIGWVVFPFFMWILSAETKEGAHIGEREKNELLSYTRDTFRYFEDFVSEKTHGLPPDNVQFSPTYAEAMRTSPTNIGMYLLSLLAACDLRFISADTLCTRAAMTAETLERLRKWNGHLYNWYDVQTLAVLGGGFVSTVDSGNLIASLITFCEGAKEYAGEVPALLDVVSVFSRIIKETDFSALYDPRRKLFTIGYSVSEGTFSDSHYDVFMSEARTASFLAVALLQVSPAHYFTPSRRVIGRGLSHGLSAWSGTAFEYFMPAIFLPRIRGSASEQALAYAYKEQKRTVFGRGKKRSVFGISECGYFAFDGAMNYQYRAFGVDTLALDPMMETGKTVAPYASFLMLENDPSEILRNLEALRAIGAYGKYGFYEAVDFDPARVGGGYAVLQSVMSHHAGMSILSAANLLSDGRFRKRFLQNEHMRAARELLAEKMPTVCTPLPPKRTFFAAASKNPKSIPFSPAPHSYHLLSPECALLSNNKTKIFLSSSGHVEWIDGREAVFLSEFDRFSLRGGLRVYVNIDGTVFPTVPLGEAAEGFSSAFSFLPAGEIAEYRSVHQNSEKKYEIRLRISVFPDKEFAELSCSASGSYEEMSALLYFEPVLAEKRSYLAHKSFSDLFLESRFYQEESAILFSRRPRGDRRVPPLLGITVTPDAGPAFDTMKDRVLPLAPRERDYAGIAKKEHLFTASEGAVILPVCALQSGTTHFGKRISFYMGLSKDADELLYQLSECKTRGGRNKRKQKMGALLHLQHSAAGLAAPAEAFERYLLRGMIFGIGKKTTAPLFSAKKESLWKHGLSGDHPIVLAEDLTDEDGAFSRLSELIALFKYLCIRGVRYDFVILYKESDPYAQTVRKKIDDRLRRAGCEHFLSFVCGIYPLRAEMLSGEEKAHLRLLSSARFSLLYPLAQSVSESTLMLSPQTEALLLKSPMQRRAPAPMPPISPIGEMESGYFHEKGFLIRKPHGKAPFAHILASEHFGAVLTENSLGFTFARNAGMQKLTPHTADGFYEDTGERIFLRIYDRKDPAAFRDHDLCASAAWADFRFDSVRYHGVIGAVSYTVCVSLLAKHDAKRLCVSLESVIPVTYGLYYAVRPCLSDTPAPAHHYKFEKTNGGIRIRLLVNEKGFGCAVFSPDASVFDTDTAALRTDGSFFDETADAAILGIRGELDRHKEHSFFLTAFFSEKQFHHLQTLCLGKVLSPAYDVSVLFSGISVESGHPLFDEITDKWSVYQTLVCRIHARSGFYQVSGAYGFRDQLQDMLALIPIAPQKAKMHILRAAAHQYEDGSAQHWWHPTEGTGIRTKCSDDFLWLCFVTADYIEKTGDLAILQTKLPYLSSAPLSKNEHERYERAPKSTYRESLLSHLLRAVSYGRARGAHNLPLIGTCDWNDGMNTVGIEGKGESVWLAFFRILVLRKMITICELAGEEHEIPSMKEEIEALFDALRQFGFDGAWYLRGYYDDGSILGGASRVDCRIDVLPQAFAAMLSAECGFERERAKESMDAVWKMLYDKEHALLKLLTPPFDTDAQAPGYIKGYVPGIRENGGQYTHAAVWAAIGFFACGENEKAADVLFSINPAERQHTHMLADSYRIEPYVFAGDVYTNENHMGRGGWSWYTGSAAWYRKAALEYLCGYTEKEDGFFLCPHLSDRFSHFVLHICKKDTRYRIEVRMANAPSLVLDGEYIHEKDRHFFRFDGKTHMGFLKVKR